MNELRIRSSVELPMPWSSQSGTIYSFDGLSAPHDHVAIRFGEPCESPLVRIHSECLTGDIFGSQRCDCGPQLREAMQRLGDAGGYLFYLRQEGRGIGLYAKLDAYLLQDTGMDTFEANRHLDHPDDARDFTVAAAMLRALNIRRCRLLTNNPDKMAALRAGGIVVDASLPTGVFATSHNYRYLLAKVREKHHAIQLPTEYWSEDAS